MTKGFAINNSMTNHGGIIQATQQRTSQMGNLFLRAGDGHFCPKCKCWSTIQASHNHFIMDGEPVAYVDDLLSCGAKILPKQDHVVGTSQGENYNKNTNFSSFSAQGLTLYSGQYQLVNLSNNQPYSNVKYIVTYADGRVIEGVTDENGMTEKLKKTEKSQDIEIKLFEADSW
ncbi:PAAR domain-containing protein [uncultured Acinetobacter sp.]|uniref:PAAR domain-containing protein n=1 Tax=uncultured Acinetobacter sp. TaxID=165433 RepID=UPI00258DD922|nr:PAAR domain-containing protein [uncultured Acinetobacter sp.]